MLPSLTRFAILQARAGKATHPHPQTPTMLHPKELKPVSNSNHRSGSVGCPQVSKVILVRQL